MRWSKPMHTAMKLDCCESWLKAHRLQLNTLGSQILAFGVAHACLRIFTHILISRPLHTQNLTYSVKHARKRGERAVLLDGVSAFMNPGEMTALVRVLNSGFVSSVRMGCTTQGGSSIWL